MRTFARRLVFLLGTLTFVICAVFYTKSRKKRLEQVGAQVTWSAGTRDCVDAVMSRDVFFQPVLIIVRSIC